MKKKQKSKKFEVVEIVRSFKFPVSMGQYLGTTDFFASYKAECKGKDADDIAEKLHEFAKKWVMKDVNKFLAEGKKVEPITRIFKAKVVSPNDTLTFTPLQGKSKAEKADRKVEVKEGVMRDVVESEIQEI